MPLYIHLSKSYSLGVRVTLLQPILASSGVRARSDAIETLHSPLQCEMIGNPITNDACVTPAGATSDWQFRYLNQQIHHIYQSGHAEIVCKNAIHDY